MLYLVRHGAVALKAGRWYLGQIEVPLSAEGLLQADRLHNLLRRVPFRGIYSSDLSRAQRTAAAIAEGREQCVQPLREFREINLGEWDGCTFKEIMEKFPQAYQARGEDLEHFRPPNGESFGDVRKRVLPALRSILETPESNILLVAHRAVNRVILCDVLGLPISNILRIRQDYGCLNILGYEPSGCYLKLLNYTPRAVGFAPETAAMKWEVALR